MQRIDGHLVLSPTDLTKHVACAHITTLDLQALDSDTPGRKGVAADDALNLVFTKGLEHEYAYLEQLRAEGRTIEDVAELGLTGAAAEEATLAAMQRGVDVIYQATFFDGRWFGLADFLLRVDEPSALGGWRYDIADTKLARRLKVPALLQMATYAARLETLQGAAPKWLTVVTGDKQARPWRLVDVAPYARRRRDDLLDAIDNPRPTVSGKVAHCGQCRWRERCGQEWLDADDLVQVAGMRVDHRAALIDLGIPTLRALAEATDESLAPLSRSVRTRLQAQARLQLAERETGERQYALLDPEPGRGLQMLPEPDEGDVYLDFEGDPWADGGRGREYLAGIWTRQEEFVEFWAHDADEEGRLTTDLVDWLTERWQKFPDMHVYHYAPYETTALKRLVSVHATREHELDQLLRGERFVDLYAVVRQGLRISKESYSIKKLEDFYWGQTRPSGTDAVSDGLSSVVEYERWLTHRAGGVADQTILDDIRRYNIDDVRSTLALHDWLEQRRDELGATGVALTRPAGQQAEEINEAEQAEIDLADDLLSLQTEDAALLAGCVGWHRREDRPAWWDFFHYGDLDPEELIESSGAAGGLGAPEQVGVVKQSFVWRYPMPPQECQLKLGARAHDIDTHKGVGELVGLDPVEGWVEVKMGKRVEPPLSRGLKDSGPINNQVMRDSIARTARLTLGGGSNLPARLVAGVVPDADALRAQPGESSADVVVRVGSALAGEVLAVQGPPGAGKTTAGARLIRSLLDDGKRVGVTGLSHSVIRTLLEAVDRPALQKGAPESPTPAADAAGDEPLAPPLIRSVAKNEEIAAALDDGSANLVGGTAWLWSRDDLTEAVDVLVIDEAGQFSLANAVAVAQAATSLVLLGDPQQLQQPTQAAHPFGAGVSALEHLIGPHDVIPADRGVFLDHTYRIHPSLTRFVSELAYEGRLESAPPATTPDGSHDLSRVAVTAPGLLTGTGLRWLPVRHTRRVEQASEQEAQVVRGLVDDLLRGRFTDSAGATHPITLDDVLVVAPYNAHVAALRHALPEGARVGTVDKFQGRQGAVVIYSMGSTSAADAPRGVSFLYDVHRLNVAISRAKAIAVVVGSPLLLDAEVHTPEDLRAVNALCRYVEQATTV